MPNNPIAQIFEPCIILAGAGTGKTYTIVEKIKHIIQNSIYAPEKIVCLTFSNEAVNALRNRKKTAFPEKNEPVIRTFHSFCADLIKAKGNEIGIKKDFRILVPDEAKIMLHKNLKVHPMLCSKYVETMSTAKDLVITKDVINDYLEKSKAKEYIDNLQDSVEAVQFELNTRHAIKKTYNKSEIESKRERLKRLSALLKLQKFARV